MRLFPAGFMQAHHNAQQHAEEFVVELLVSLDKMQVLVQNLLAIEVSACLRVATLGKFSLSLTRILTCCTWPNYYC